MRKLRLFSLNLIVIAALPFLTVQAAESPVQYMPKEIEAYQVIRFDNGFSAIINRRGTSPYIAARLIVDVGSNDYDCPHREMPHLAEHLMFSGYDDLSESDLDGAIAAYGGSWNAVTNERQTVYEMQFHSSHAMEAIWLLWGMMSETEISQEEFEIAKTVVNSESNGEPGSIQQFMYRNGIFGGHVKRAFREYVPDTQAWCDSLVSASTISLEDVQRLLSEEYTPSNMTLIVVGDMNIDGMRDDVELTFGMWDKPETKETPYVAEPLTYVPTTYTTRLGSFLGQESYISIEFGIPSAGHPDREDLTLARYYLQTRMFEEFRIKDGLAYDPRAYITDYDDYSVLGLDATVRTKDIDRALSMMDRLLEDFRDGGVSEKWVEHIRNSYKLRLASGFESNTDIADYYVRHIEHWQRYGHFPRHEFRYDAVTPKSVRASADRYIAPGGALRFVSQPLLSYEGLFIPAAFLVLITLWLWRRKIHKRPL